jgi:hypothetical protein
LPAGELARAVTLHESIVAAVRAAGYRHACLDLSGMRTGTLETPWVPVEGALVATGGRSLP